MHRTRLSAFHCSVARTSDILGEWWTPLIVRDAFYGQRRFEEFQRSLGLARNVLAARLERLVVEGIFERRRYADRPPRHEYVLTEKGRDLFPIIAAMLAWGDRWSAGDDGPPLLLMHEPCGRAGSLRSVCDQCGEPLDLSNIRPIPGPGA